MSRVHSLFKGTRYGFGQNWLRYLKHVDTSALEAQIAYLKDVFGVASFESKTFLDIGSGSGLSSLAAHRMGATVRSFDYDPDSVKATSILWEREGRPATWTVGRGDVLDGSYLRSLPQYDVVHAWGVLHHTGDMWKAIESAAAKVKPEGVFMLGIYHKKLPQSLWMWHLKRIYVSCPGALRLPIKLGFWGASALYRLSKGKTVLDFLQHGKTNPRGMNYWRDLDDWLGGFPFEYASAEEVVDFIEALGFSALKVRPGCSMADVGQYVFRRSV